jgi:hypothetical protein
VKDHAGNALEMNHLLVGRYHLTPSQIYSLARIDSRQRIDLDPEQIDSGSPSLSSSSSSAAFPFPPSFCVPPPFEPEPSAFEFIRRPPRRSVSPHALPDLLPRADRLASADRPRPGTIDQSFSDFRKSRRQRSNVKDHAGNALEMNPTIRPLPPGLPKIGE